MVVVTLITTENGKIFYFDEPLPKTNYVRLISCSIFNSWHNLERAGEMILESGDTIVSLPEGHYTVESIAKELKASFEYYKKKAKLYIETNNPNSVLKITNWETKSTEISVSWGLSNLLGIGRKLPETSYVKKLNSLHTYFIRSNLID